ncbi:MAG: hypothetical protein JOZ83_08830 [Silvibacterium sp.]|nr:hypothetical protein [Silvibacterium sp.]
MRKITAVALFSIAGFLAAGDALAQDQSLKATIPFDFSVGNNVLPAGTYTVTRESQSIVLIHNAGTTGALAVGMPDNRESEHGKELVFVSYGDHYFLHEILGGSGSINLDFPATRREKQVRQQLATLQKPSEILIAAR